MTELLWVELIKLIGNELVDLDWIKADFRWFEISWILEADLFEWMSKGQSTSIAENWIWIEMIFFELHWGVAFMQIRMNHGSLDCPSWWRHRNRYKIGRNLPLSLPETFLKNLFALVTERHMHFSWKKIPWTHQSWSRANFS